jgi:enamine deaminase RidA (YjgF/YER057c/UK114 family)
MAHSSPIPAATISGNLLYSSLITGADQARTMPESLAEQAENMFAQLQTIMKAAGGNLTDVVKVTIWLNDRGDRKLINQLWERWFPDRETRPARVTLNRDLGSGKKIECEVIAVLAAS